MMTWTLRCSTSSRALAKVPAGWPPLSTTVSSTRRPASVFFCCWRNSSIPFSISLPGAASGPVRIVTKPTRMGSCAAAGAAARTARAGRAERIGLRHRVVHERGREALPELVVGHVLPESLADPLGEPSVDLSLDEQRVDDAPAVVHGHEAEEADGA